MVFIIIFVFLIGIIILFSFPQFSPIPYFPSNMKDKENILKALSLKNNQTIIDLGAGDGVVVFEAAYESWRRKLNTKFMALEINPVLIGILWLKWLLHPNRTKIRIVWGDMFKIRFRLVIGGSHARGPDTRAVTTSTGGKSMTDRIYNQRITFYLYISPWLIEKIISRIQKQLPGSSFVSYFYPIKSLKKREKVLRGLHNVYVYK